MDTLNSRIANTNTADNDKDGTGAFGVVAKWLGLVGLTVVVLVVKES